MIASLGNLTCVDNKILIPRKLGKTGIEVPLIIIGCGSRFMAIRDEDKALELLEYALDRGLYYWDTAANYRNDQISSEERIGKLLKDRRKEVFLATKVEERDGESAKKTTERSLKQPCGLGGGENYKFGSFKYLCVHRSLKREVPKAEGWGKHGGSNVANKTSQTTSKYSQVFF